MPKGHTTIHTILEQFREAATSPRDQGDRFERLICRYLELDPIYADRFSRVWMWNDWPDKGRVGDVGVDIVAQERATGEYCAIQCKFYDPKHTLSKEDIDSFFTAAGHPLFTSCMIVSTTDHWGKNAEHAIQHQGKPVTRLRAQDLDNSPVDWSTFDARRLQALGVRKRKSPRPHQVTAIDSVVAGFSKADRGKLIMACGTGKTYVALCIAEKLAPTGHVLVLVPSLSLLSQCLREWTAEATVPMHCLAVCSDAGIGRRRTKVDDDSADITTCDLAFPATTSTRQLLRQLEAINSKRSGKGSARRMTVVFSTYQSIDAVSEAQSGGLPDFDLIVCDEAHRTTGVTLSGEDESHFVKVHDSAVVRGKKRLYMTATPRIFGDDSKVKAKDANAELCSMDDSALYGPEFHRLGFGEAVAKGLLSDYKVLVLAVDEKYVSRTFQRQLAEKSNELNLEDAVKITGCWNGLAKRLDPASGGSGETRGDAGPMRRAVAFSRSIKDSKAFVQKFEQIIAAYRESHPDEPDLLHCELDHVDGTFNSLRRHACLDWLKAPLPSGTCRILSNARCLSEGVDVPALDAVLFLNPRNSVIDVVQSVGRVMRKAEEQGKSFGYIILPIGVPADMAPEEALKDNEKYRVVWQVLQALRAHDDRFNATVNQLELNRARPDNIQVIGVGEPTPAYGTSGSAPGAATPHTLMLFPNLDEWKNAIFARIVLKCGDRRYWESWAKDVAAIADRHVARLKALLGTPRSRHASAFADFLAGLRENINPAITQDDAIEMLAQHLVTRPVFDALFQGHAFTKHNPVSVAMQRMLDSLEDQAIEKETATLDRFYASVRDRAAGIDNPEGRQRVVIELYNEFFRTAFPRVAERLGIVYTPVEVVDFIVRSAAEALQAEFGRSLGDPDVHIIDPFTGTGTFIVRLLQSGLIEPGALKRKYESELHANEIILLAYYIAAVNIEAAYHLVSGASSPPSPAPGPTGARGQYQQFEGIVLTDTFQMYESKGEILERMFPENNRRVKRQRQSPIRVIIANPPYSAQQDSENDANKNLDYPTLDERIRSTYAARSRSKLAKSSYDSYVRAIRWATDRLDDRGIVALVTNASFLESNNLDGLRAMLAEEFSRIYVFNLRGNARTQGEQRRKEKGNIFGEGTRTPVAITVCVKNPATPGPAEIMYCDIGDYLDREEKLNIVRRFGSIGGIARAARWQRLRPNQSHDWLNQRDPAFSQFMSLGDKDGKEDCAVFATYSLGVVTNRDAWTYNMSRPALEQNMRRMITTYNAERERYARFSKGKSERPDIDGVVDRDPRKISWTRSLKASAQRGKAIRFERSAVTTSMYRPFVKEWLYFDRRLNEMVYLMPSLFPTPDAKNIVIAVTGVGAAKEFSCLIADCVPNLHMQDTGQAFPLYVYEDSEGAGLGFKEEGSEIVGGMRRRSAISPSALQRFRRAYGDKLTHEDVFYYVYGVLHSAEYRSRFASDLKKQVPRIPFTRDAKDFWRFSKGGRDLANWHLNYERVEPFPLQESSSVLGLEPDRDCLVQKMTFGRKGKEINRSTVVVNDRITLSGIPDAAHDYVVNGKSALEWLMDRYQVMVDRESGIRNDPNAWGAEQGHPRYIIDLIKRVVRVSVETVAIVNSLPPLNESQGDPRPGRSAATP